MAEQIIGEIFDKVKANEEFGEVRQSVEVKSELLKKLLTKSEEYVMFNIETNDFKMLDEKRNSLKGNANSDDEIFYRVSISKIEELLKKGKNGTTQIEMRPNTLTITNGEFTLERTVPCPPFCG